MAITRFRGDPESSVTLSGLPLGFGREGFRRLDERLVRILGEEPEARGRIDASTWVPHGDVIRCLDSFLLAGADRVDFAGAPPPRGRR